MTNIITKMAGVAKPHICRLAAALALTLGLASTAWAAASLEETGATVPTTATLAFKEATLSQVTADTLSAAFGGGSAGTATGAAPTFNNFDRTDEASGTITCQAQVADDGYIKSVLLTFTQSGSDVNVLKSGAKYITGSAVGPSTASGSDGNYDINKLKLTLGKPTPIAVFDGASGGFKKTSINGVTFDKNGNTVPDDGSYVKISASVGALFKLSQGYSYVVGEFTVTNLNESAAADRVLALWSPAEDGTSTASPGVLLKSGTVDTRGVWLNALWGDNQTTLNGTLATGISADTSRTFALTTEDSKVNDVQNNTGTHLFELTGANPGTAVYGGTTVMGLRGDQTYRTLAIGGPATGSLSAMTDLVITKVVIYASDSRQFTSTDPTTIANVENPAAFVVGNGETINASTINAGVTASGAAYVYTEAGATLNLDAELMGRATFSGSISGVPVSTIGLTLGSENDKVTLANASYDHVFKGTGTVVYPDNTIPSASAIWLKSSDWAGTLSLNNIQGSSSGQPGWYAPFHNYGSSNSTIKVSGFTGFFGGGNYESPATLEIAAGSTFTLNNGNNGNSMTFAKLTGSGDIVICGNNGPAIQYVMRDASAFAGNITVSQSGSSSFCKSIVLGGGSSYNYNVNNYKKQICVLGNVTIPAGKTWVADDGIVVKGTLNVGSGVAIPAIAAGSTGAIIAMSGTATISGVQGNAISAGLGMVGGTIAVSGATGITELTIPADTALATQTFVAQNGNKLDLSACTSLTTLKLNLGSSTSFDLGNVILPASCTTVKYVVTDGSLRDLPAYTAPTGLGSLSWASEFVLTETRYEYANGTFSVANVPANASVTVTRPDGSSAIATVTDGTARLADYGTVRVTGAACWHAYEFNNNWTDSVSTGAHDCKTWNSDEPNFAEDPDKEGNYFVYTSIRPGPTDANGKVAYSFPSEWSAAIRCTTPSTANSIIVCFGKAANTSSSQNQYIALVSGDTAGKVRLVHGAGNGAAEDIAEMTVANPTSSQHVYVFTKTATTVTVYCDGDLITSKAVTASPYNGFQFGTMYGGMKAGSGLSAVTAKATGGMVDYTRLYNFAIGQNMIQKLADDDPYVSSTPTYSREVSGSPWWYTGEGTWLKSDDSTLVGVPDASGIVDVTATADATMTVNLPAAPVYEMLTFRGAGAVTLVKNGNSPKIETAKLVVKTDVTAPFDIADFSGARVSVDAGKKLTFDFTSYTFEGVTGVTTQQVTGIATRADDRFDIASTEAWASRLSLIYDAEEYTYSVVIDPVATVTKNNTTVAYPTVAAALTAFSTDAGTLRLFVDYDQDITLSVGQSLDTGSTTYTGTVSPTGTNIELATSGTTYTAVDNSTNTWAPVSGGGNRWETAANWSNGVVPNTYTAVTFPASENGHVVYLTHNNVAPQHHCASMAIVGDVTFQRGAGVWAYVLMDGNITGTGTMTLEQVGIKTADNGSVTVSCPVVGNAASNDNFFTGSGATYTFSSAVTVAAGEFKAEYTHLVFNGLVTICDGAYVKANGAGSTATFNGGIAVPENAAARLTVDSGTHTIASTVTLADGATLTVPTSSTTVSGATFATSVADSYVKSTAGESTTVYSVAAKTVVTVSVGDNVSLAINGNAVSDGATLKFAPGDTFTYVATPAANYTAAVAVTGGTDNNGTVTVGETAITVAATAARNGITVSNVAFEYGANYATADVTATVSDPSATYTLTVGQNSYNGSVSGTTVTFTGVATGHATAYDSVNYAITATDGASSVDVTGGSGSALVADSDKWVDENSGTTGTAAAGGSWSNAVTYAENVAAISDNTFTASNCSTGDLVTVTIENVVYEALSDLDISLIAADSQGAFCLGAVEANDVVTTNFMILAKEDSAFVWKPATWSGTPALNTEYDVEFSFDYAHGKYSVSINGASLSVNNSTSFDLCTSKTEVKAVDFKGSGKLSSILGIESTGYMVRDSAGNWYATIADAINNFSAANGPYFVLHAAGTPPAGWKIVPVDGVSILKKDVSGVMILTF